MSNDPAFASRGSGSRGHAGTQEDDDSLPFPGTPRSPIISERFAERSPMISGQSPSRMGSGQNFASTGSVSVVVVDDVRGGGVEEPQAFPSSASRGNSAASAIGPTPSAAVEFREAILGQPVMNAAASVEGLLNEAETSADLAPFHLDPEFDVSTRHLVKVFNQLDTDKTGLLTYEQAAEGLRGLWRSTQTISDELLWRLVREIDTDGSRNVTQEEFVRFMQEYVARNAEKATGTLAECFCYDYSRTSSNVEYITADGSDGTTPLARFLERPRFPADKGTVRWVHIAGRDASTVLRIATRYNLSQLEVEDALNDYEAPKISTFPSRIQLVMNELFLIRRGINGEVPAVAGDADESREAIRENARPTHAQLEVRNSNLNVFLIDARLVLSIARCKTDVTRILQQRILYPGSKMRLHDARFLFYSIVDTVVDQGFPILKELQDEMAVYQTEIYADKATSIHVMRHLAFTQREVDKLESYYPPITNVVSRMPDVLCQAEHADYNDYLRKHIVDIGEHALTLNGMVTRLAKWGRSLSQMYGQESASRMNEIMMSLTLLTATFMPVQLLSGIFGMNFTHNWGILDWKYSYFVFWVLVMIIGVSMFLVFRRLGWIKGQI